MRRRSVVQGIPSLGLVPVEVEAIVRADESDRAELLHSGGAFFAVTPAAQTRVRLGTHTNTVAYFDASFDLGADTNDRTNDLVPDAGRIFGGTLRQNQLCGTEERSNRRDAEVI